MLSLFYPFESLLSPSLPYEEDTSITTTEDQIQLSIDVPGFRPEDLDINLDRGTLTIRGSAKVNNKTRTIQRSYYIAKDSDPESIRATVDLGVLTVSIARQKRSATKIRVLPGVS